ncbi:MAG: aspartate aminotransferase family protein [Anaerolineae bacterium]
MQHKHPHGHVFYRKLAHARPKIARGEGIYLWDENGRRYIDGTGGPFVVNVGHGRTEIVKAMARQAQQTAYVHGTMFTSEPVEAFASALAPLVQIPDARFYFLSSGSEVVEAAVKLARQIQLARGERDRHLVISRWHSYHGLTLGALSLSGRASLRAPFLSMVKDAPHIQPPYSYRDPVSGREAADRLEASILTCGPKNVAAFIAEPISGASLGAAVPPDDYWTRIREICDQYGLLLIADEVIVGLGRTGQWWALDHWDVRPDILVTSKGLAGGYFPLGFMAVGTADVEQLRQAQGDFEHGGTFSHHAVGASAGLATLRIIQQEGLVENAAVMGALLGQRLCEALADHPNVGDIRGRGLLWGVELVQNRQTQQPFPASRHVAQRLWQRAFDAGLIIYYSQGCADGVNGDLIMLGPPLIVNQGQIDEIVELLRTAVWEELPGETAPS